MLALIGMQIPSKDVKQTAGSRNSEAPPYKKPSFLSCLPTTQKTANDTPEKDPVQEQPNKQNIVSHNTGMLGCDLAILSRGCLGCLGS